MKKLSEFSGKIILLSSETEAHIAEEHHEISLKNIRDTLLFPDEVRRSSYKNSSLLYYRQRVEKRYICVIVKQCEDGFFISTAMTTTKPKSGEVIYVKEQ